MSEPPKPPAVPLAVLNFFSNQPDFPAVIGDLSEEFHQRVQHPGAKAAKLWYWREAFRNTWALTAREVLRTPVKTVLAAFGSVVAVNAVTALFILASLYLSPFRSIGEFIFHQNQVRLDLLLLFQFVASLALGWLGGRLLPGREWALALMYTLMSACWAGAGIAIGLFYFSISPAFYLRELPEGLRLFMFWEIAFRLGAFWLGYLWIRRSRQSVSFNGLRIILYLLPSSANPKLDLGSRSR